MYIQDQAFVVFQDVSRAHIEKDIDLVKKGHSKYLGLFDPILSEINESLPVESMTSYLPNKGYVGEHLLNLKFSAPRGYSITCVVGVYDELIPIHQRAVEAGLKRAFELLIKKHRKLDIKSIRCYCIEETIYKEVPLLGISCYIPLLVKDVDGNDYLLDKECFWDIKYSDYITVYNKYMFDELVKRGYKLRRTIDNYRFELEEFDEFKIIELHNRMSMPREYHQYVKGQ